jgi:bifunctional N-acetylglucosamine-1-phosphate-uridyltransferase/glucosamine-1-phosphate-acetyltransferase GlmU-like protein
MIVIPMAGQSSRFFKAGFTAPKYMLEAHGKTLFEHAVSSFKNYFDKKSFLFIVRDDFHSSAFVQKKALELGIKEFRIVTLKSDTRGQAETVAVGLEDVKGYNGEITVFNIDSLRPGFTFPEVAKDCAGYLEVFPGAGDNWSFAKPVGPNSTLVAQTAEKKPISNLCSTGLYYFSRKQYFLDAYNHYLSKPERDWEQGELYIAPLYNQMISQGLEVRYHKISPDEVIFCGVPSEYEEFLKKDI